MSGTTVYYHRQRPGSSQSSMRSRTRDRVRRPAPRARSAARSTGWTHTASAGLRRAADRTFRTRSAGPRAPRAARPRRHGKDLANNTATTTIPSSMTRPRRPARSATQRLSGRQAIVTLTFTGAGQRIRTRSTTAAAIVRELRQRRLPDLRRVGNLSAPNPVSPYTDRLVVNSKCYNYRYVLTDLVGNTFTATSASTAWVDYAGAVDSRRPEP